MHQHNVSPVVQPASGRDLTTRAGLRSGVLRQEHVRHSSLAGSGRSIGPGDVTGPCPDACASLSGSQIVVNFVHLNLRWVHAEFLRYWADLVIGEALELFSGLPNVDDSDATIGLHHPMEEPAWTTRPTRMKR